MKSFCQGSGFIAVFLTLLACRSSEDDRFPALYSLLDQKNFFQAQMLYQTYQDELSGTERDFTEAILDNAFNRIEASQGRIDELLNKDLPDSLRQVLYDLNRDNAIKLYNYRGAKAAVDTLLSRYQNILTDEDVSDYQNDRALWAALEGTPPQTVTINERTDLPMAKDRAGLSTLTVSAQGDSLNFIFDTGANLSTTSQTVARQLGMKLIPASIAVGSITGNKVSAALAVCEQLTLGNISLQHVVFLVMPDEALLVEPIDYQIYGILGFPVIEALGEVQITQDGHFVVPQQASAFAGDANLAMDGLTPLICLEGKPFTFDTGANTTVLYQAFYQERQEAFDAQYPPDTISFAGAGGAISRDGYVIKHTFDVSGRPVTLPEVQLLKEKVKPEETVYGNIGQDIISQFDTMTLNFDEMFIQFK